ncbi:MAG: 4Fe-4S binding protein [Candidatus Odinarchaeota archaeon]
MTEKRKEEIRIGVYPCHCGLNIGGFLDVDAVAEYAKTLPDVVVSRANKYTCSDAGQAEIKKDIRELNLNRVVVASCTARTHEPIFRDCCAEAGLNPYLFTLANIREHCSWIHMNDHDKATEKAKDIVRMYVAKARNLEPQPAREVPVIRRALVIGAGVAGMQAARDLGDMGYEVILVEKYPSIGGTMARLDKVYPTNDCSICILGPIMTIVGQHPNITLYSNSVVKDVSGYVGNFNVKILKKRRQVSLKDCSACGMCAEKCPVEVPNDWDANLSMRKAIYMPFPQAVPAKYLIDEENCSECGACAKACPRNAINYDEQDEIIEVEVGTVIIASGYKIYTPPPGNRYGYGKFDNVVTTLELERITNASGTTGGKLVRPGDLRQPKKIAFIQCVGSRSLKEGEIYCSSYCCMSSMKLAQLIKEKYDVDIYIFYMDIRAPFRGYEEYFRDARAKYDMKFIRGIPGKFTENPNGSIRITVENTLTQEQLNMDMDLVVLAVGAQPNESYKELQLKLAAPLAKDGFFMEAHPQLRPSDTVIDGVYIAGMAQGPKDIMFSVVQGSAAASRAARLLTTGKADIEPITAFVNQEKCIGCGDCVERCPYHAISLKQQSDGTYKSEILEAVCKGCGTCVVTCNPGAIEQRHFNNRDIISQIDALMEE